MTKNNTEKYKRALDDDPLVPKVAGVDFEPYQKWAKATLGYEFDDPSLLVIALTHRSYVNEHRRVAKMHNERLEFLGDAVLELVVTDYLFRHYRVAEGVMTSWRAALVRTESIRDAGEALGYAPLVRMSKGERQGSEHAKLHIVANCFEALLGATYLDKGYEEAKKIVDKYILSNVDDVLESGSWRDPKSHLQEITQRTDGVIPEYRVVDEAGPDHDKTFTVAVYVGDREIGRGMGGSKQHAEQAAATAAVNACGKG